MLVVDCWRVNQQSSYSTIKVPLTHPAENDLRSFLSRDRRDFANRLNPPPYVTDPSGVNEGYFGAARLQQFREGAWLKYDDVRRCTLACPIGHILQKSFFSSSAVLSSRHHDQLFEGHKKVGSSLGARKGGDVSKERFIFPVLRLSAGR